MVDHNEEDRRPVIDPLQGGAGDDLAAADRTAGLELGDEGVAHGGAELLGEGGRAKGEDAVDVGLDPAGVERGDRVGEPLDEGQVVGVGGGDPAGAIGGSGDPEAGKGDTAGEGGAGGDAGVQDTADHDETLPRQRLATWVAAGLLAAVGAAALAVAMTNDDTSDRDEVIAFSEDFIQTFTAYDHATFDDTEAAVAARSTESFASRYRALLGGAGFVEALRDNEAKATSQISIGPLVATLAEHEARTFAIVEQEVTGLQLEQPQRTRLRVEVVLVETPDGWKVVDVETT